MESDDKNCIEVCQPEQSCLGRSGSNAALVASSLVRMRSDQNTISKISIIAARMYLDNTVSGGLYAIEFAVVAHHRSWEIRNRVEQRPGRRQRQSLLKERLFSKRRADDVAWWREALD
jgi:hypothetical protein